MSACRRALCPLALLALAAAGCQDIGKGDEKPFNALMSTYLASPSIPRDVREKPTFKGKMVVIDRKERQVSPLHWQLAADRRAKGPDEVGTVVWLDWGVESIGSYNRGQVASVATCQVCVIDLATSTLIGRKSFRGSEPPMRVKRAKDDDKPISGDRPEADVVSYLDSLPR